MLQSYLVTEFAFYTITGRIMHVLTRCCVRSTCIGAGYGLLNASVLRHQKIHLELAGRTTCFAIAW